MKKINVLQFICPAGFYGAEMWVLALAKSIDPQRINCHLAITLESEKQNIELYKRFQSLGLESHQIKIRGRFDPLAIPKLSRLIKQKKIDIIHTHGYKSDILGLIAARIVGIKSVATPHGFENAPDLKLQAFIRLGCLALKHFDCVAPLSEELRSDMKNIKVRTEKIHLIMNGVDLEEIESERNRLSSSPLYPERNEKRIGYLGQIAYRKNVDDLLKTFDLLYQDHKNIRLILIGDGAKRSELEEKAKSMPSSSQIEFLGYRDDRLRFLKEMDLFSMTSSLEGIPRCMMEAMAMEVPVASYNIPGVDKLIIHKKTGLLAEFGHVEDLKKCWEQLLFDGKFSAQMARNGRKHVIENFSAKRMAEEYTKLYQDMVTEGHSA
jgi:glycosyltransferase involved in cell wall biosynthesis